MGGRVPAELGTFGFRFDETLADHVSGENNTTELGLSSDGLSLGVNVLVNSSVTIKAKSKSY